MKFTEILEQFRALGGTANNIELRYGSFGKGLFPIDPKLPIKIVAPDSILISPNCIKLNNKNQIRLKLRYKFKIDSKLVTFFEQYQDFFGWGDGGVSEVQSRHLELKALPEKIKQLLLSLGWVKNDFYAKSPKDYLKDYFISRQIGIKGESKIMPIFDLINHSAKGNSYIVDNGVRFEGIFKGELLGNYHRNFDAFHFYRNYGVPSESFTILSCDVKIEIPDIGVIKIARFDNTISSENGLLKPRIMAIDSEIHISFLEISDKTGSELPRKNFIEQMQKFNIPKAELIKIFDGLIDHNIKMRKDLIAHSKYCLYKIARDIEQIAGEQLNAISKGKN
ncbi:hypothetical protein MCEMSEM29_00479 [Methylophilaceae bacterium]